MTSSTKDRLAAAAAQLLDRGGQEAVTLRAVAEKVGVSHNAPYKHFRDRSALLAGVARRDFEELNRVFADALNEEPDGASALRRALKAFVDYGLAHPSRYRLLFSDPDLQADDDFKEAATGPFKIFVQIVSRCQSGGVLPTGDPVRLSGLIFAAAHGAIDLEIGGRASDKKGLRSVMGTMNLLLKLMAP
jgi:AcrR family transcriptional regulator